MLNEILALTNCWNQVGYKLQFLVLSHSGSSCPCPSPPLPFIHPFVSFLGFSFAGRCCSGCCCCSDSFKPQPSRRGRRGLWKRCVQDRRNVEMWTRGNVNGKLMAIIYWNSHDHFQLRNSSTRCSSSSSSFIFLVLPVVLAYLLERFLALQSNGGNHQNLSWRRRRRPAMRD